MILSNPRSIPAGRLLPALALLLVLVPGLAGAAPWKPVLPMDPAARARLIEAGQTRPASSASYAWLEPGDEIRFDVVGEGELRIRTRPVFADTGDDEVFRLAVCYDDTTCRYFKRRSAVDATWSLERVDGVVPAAPLLLGEEDVLEIGMPALDAPLTLRNRSRTKAVLVRVLVRGGLEPAAPRMTVEEPEPIRSSVQTVRTRVDWDVDLLQLGWDSNAYLAPADSSSEQGRFFWPVRAGVDWRRTSRDLTWKAGYSFSGRLYDDEILNEYRNRLDAEQSWRPDRDSKLHDFRFGLEESFATKNETFFGRGDDVEFETITDGAALSLKDRFDAWTFSAGPVIDWQASGTLELTGAFSYLRRDYREDYAGHSDIYSLDQDRFEYTLEADWEATDQLEVSAQTGLTDKRYDEKFVRDADGLEIRSETARYVRTWAQVELDWEHESGLSLGAELKLYRNRDQFAGYWDSDGFAIEGTAGWETEGGHRVRARLRRSSTDYDLSRVGNDPSEPLRSKDVWNLRADGRYRLSDRVDAVARLHYKDYDYNSRLFAYERLLTRAGVAVSF